jgi:D-alanyl-D-alanine carboxypeptidase
MNVEGKRLELRDSKFNNPHGLMDIKNTSSAYDMGRLTYYCWKNSIFRKVVGT